jgi:uncharacterized membrane protein SirB2
MMKFLKYLIVTLMDKYGSFMWIGTHISMTQTDWHWLLETFFCVLVNFLVIFSLYLQYKEIENEKLQKTDNT